MVCADGKIKMFVRVEGFDGSFFRKIFTYECRRGWAGPRLDRWGDLLTDGDAAEAYLEGFRGGDEVFLSDNDPTFLAEDALGDNDGGGEGPEHLVLFIHGIGEAMWRRKGSPIASLHETVERQRRTSHKISMMNYQQNQGISFGDAFASMTKSKSDEDFIDSAAAGTPSFRT